MDEKEIRQGLAALELLKAQIEGLEQQQALMRAGIEEHVRTMDSMKAVKEKKEGDEILVPIGADSFLFARIQDPSKALTGIGSGIVVESGMDSSIESLEKKIDELREAEKKVLEHTAQLEQKAVELSENIQIGYEELQAGHTGGRVQG